MKDSPQPPFYVGEIVIAVDALPQSIFKNGLLYRIYSCRYAINQSNGLGPFWYVGAERENIRSHASCRPSIFASIEQPSLMSFEKMATDQPIYAN